MTLENLAQDPWIEYTYVYGLDNKWRFFENDNYKGKESLQDVEEKLNNFFKGVNIERPKGLYGFFDERAIRIIREKQEKEAMLRKGGRHKDKSKDKDDKEKD